MTHWYILTLVGADRPGIVAQVSQALFAAGMSLGDTSMMRLGGSFTIMMMVGAENDTEPQEVLAPAAKRLQLGLHQDTVAVGLHQHKIPNIQVRVMCADRAGIIAQVTGILAAQGFNILELESDVAGTADQPVYIMNIQGYSEHAVEDLQTAVNRLQDLDVEVSAIETYIG